MGNPTQVSLNVPTPFGTSYPVSGPVSGLKNLFGIKGKGEAQTKVVQDKAGGDYRLLRQGQQGSMRLGALAQTAAKRKAGASGGSDASVVGTKPKASGKSSASHAPSAHKDAATTPESRVKAFGDGAKAMRDAIGEEASEVSRLGQDAANAGLSRSDARNLTLQHGVRQSALEREITGKLDDLRKIEADIAHLPQEQQAAARKEVDDTFRFLATKLIGVRLPGAAQMLERMDPSDLAANAKALGDVTGLDIDRLRQRYADGSARTEGGGRTPTSTLVDKPAAFAGDLLGVLRQLHEHGLLKPELMQRLAVQPQMRDWGSAVPERTRTVDKARQQLDALVVLSGQLDAITHGNGKSIDFVLGRDSRLDDYRLNLKKAFGVEVSRHVVDSAGKTQLQTTKLSEAGIEAQHGLSKGWYGLRQALLPHSKELEKLAPGLGLNAFLNPSGESEIRLDSRTLEALHKAARALGKEPKLEQVAKSVNLLVAHMMLLQRKLDSELAGTRLDDLRGETQTAKLAFAQAAARALGNEPLSTLRTFDDEQWKGLVADLNGDDPDKRDVAVERIVSNLRVGSGQTLAALGRINQNLNDTFSLTTAMADEEDPARLAEMRGKARELAVERETVLKSLTEDFGQRPTADQMDTLLSLASVASHYEGTRVELETQERTAEADHRLGLTDADLRKAGFTAGEIDGMGGLGGLFDTAEHRDTIGALAGMGLQSTADVGKVNASINKIVDRVLQRGMAQDTLDQLGKTHADGRANLVLDMFLQDVTGRPGDFRVTMADARAHVSEGVQAFTKIQRTDDEAERIIERFAETVEGHEGLMTRIGDSSAKLTALDQARNHAEAELAKLAGQINVKLDAHEPKGFELAKKLNQAVLIDQELRRHELQGVPAEHLAPMREELDRLLRDLRHLDPATMSHTMFSRGPQTREQLRAFATDTRLAIAEHIVTIRSTPSQKTAEMEKIKAAQTQADQLMAARKEIMGESHTMLVRAIRAAVVDARKNSGEAVADFDPLAHRAEIEAQLKDWGIRADDYQPEIDEVLHGTFDADTVDRWVKEGKQSVKDPALAADLQPSFGTRAKRFFGRILTDSQKIDHATKLAMVDTVKGLAPGERMFVAQGVGGKFTTGKVPLETTGTVKARLDAFGRERKLLEVQRTPHGWELFFKAGSEGGAKAGLSAEVFKIAEVGISGGFTASNLDGAGLVFAKESDLVEFLDKLMTQDSVTPKDWIKAKEAVLVDDSSFGLAGGVDAMVSTKSVSEFLETIGEPVEGLIFDTTFLGSGDVEVFVGATAKAEAGKEWRWVGERNADRVSLENEKVTEKTVTVAAGIYLGIPTVHEFLIDKFALEDTGALDRMDDFFKGQDWGLPQSEAHQEQVDGGEGHDAHLAAKDGHMWNPMSLDFNNPLSVSKDLYKRTVTEVEKVTFSRDGLLEAEGNERVKTLSVGRKLTGADLQDLSPTLSKAETARGAADELAAALRANKPVGDSGRGFATAAMALLAEADVGDELAVTYALKEDVRVVANEHIRRGQELRSQAESARKAGRTDEAVGLERQAKAEAAFVKQLQDEESNYEPSRVQLVKSTTVDKDLTIFTLGLVSMQRFNQGGISKPAITVDVPGGPAERAAARHAAHGAHGAHGAQGSHGAQGTQGASGPQASPPSGSPGHSPTVTTSLPPQTGGGSGGVVHEAPKDVSGSPPTDSVPKADGGDPPPLTGPTHPVASSVAARLPLEEEELDELTAPLVQRLVELRTDVAALQATDRPTTVEEQLETRTRVGDLFRNVSDLVAQLPTREDRDAVAWLHQAANDLRLALEFERRLGDVADSLTVDRARIQAPRQDAPDRPYYREAQSHALCSVHALNAALGGPLVDFHQLDLFKSVLYGERDPSGYRSSEVYSTIGGAFADEPYKFLQTLNRLGQIPQEIGYHVIDPTGVAGGSVMTTPEVAGDAAIVYTQNPAHFVAFRRDEAGQWRRLDSLDKGEQPVQSPQDYITAAFAKGGNRYVTLTTLQE